MHNAHIQFLFNWLKKLSCCFCFPFNDKNDAVSKQPCVALYMPMVRDTYHLSGQVERDLKSAAVDAGGSVNASGLFLSPASTAISVTSVNKCSVVFIPHH